MYKLLLSWRYLRTRYIALASIISVTLGVATMIVVNSVMAGFSDEMHKRLHGILSDIVVETVGMDGIYDAEWHMNEIRKIVGDDLAAVTAIVRVPAMIVFQHHGRTITQQVMLIGIDDETYSEVSDFRPYLQHATNREKLEFQLRDGDYDERIPNGGWKYRRHWVEYEQAYNEEIARIEQAGRDLNLEATPSENDSPAVEPGVFFAELPDTPPVLGKVTSEEVATDNEAPAASDSFSMVDPFTQKSGPPEYIFDPLKEQHTGVVLGIAVVSSKYRDAKTDKVEEHFLRLPGDDIQIALLSSSMPPQPLAETFTVVDFYESNMSEYDASFAFVPLSKVQHMRGMIDPQSGVASVTSIQLKLTEDANLVAVQRKLQDRFPPREYPYRVQTWREMQGPLLAAVQMETTILNILLFLIIAVAGFGILATFFMIVVEKTRDIGVLKALGAPSRGVMSIFLSYGLALGTVGSGVGIVLGLLFVANINTIRVFIEVITGQQVFDETIYYFKEIPTIVNPVTIVWVAIGAVLIAVLASVLPAVRAARLHPVEALRYE